MVGAILFGSIARCDDDEYSDYDLFVLFENKALMWQKWDDLFQAISNLKISLHLIPEALEELKEITQRSSMSYIDMERCSLPSSPSKPFPSP